MLNLEEPKEFEKQMGMLERGAFISFNKGWKYREPKAHPVFIMDGETTVTHVRPMNVRAPFGWVKTVINDRFFYRCNG